MKENTKYSTCNITILLKVNQSGKRNGDNINRAHKTTRDTCSSTAADEPCLSTHASSRVTAPAANAEAQFFLASSDSWPVAAFSWDNKL